MVGGSRWVSSFVFFTRFRPFGVNLQNIFFHWKFWFPDFCNLWHYHVCSSRQNFQWKKICCKSTPNGLKCVKKHKTADPSAAAIHRSCRQLIFSLEYVNTSYHTTFHQNLSINVACIHKRVLVAWKWQNNPPPPYLLRWKGRATSKSLEGVQPHPPW